MRNAGSGLKFARCALAVLLLSGVLAPLRAETTNAPRLPAAEASLSDLQNACLRLQEQLLTTQATLERNRQEAETSSERNAELLQTRLRLLEHALVGERARELDAFQDSQRLILVFAGVFAGVGLLVMLLTNFMQWRAVNRLAATTLSPPAPAFAGICPQLAALGQGAGPLAPLNTGDAANARLLGIVERLEQRVRELEHGARPLATVLTPSATAAPSASTPTDPAEVSIPAPEAPPLDLLMAKGQSLLDLGRVEEALTCFDRVLNLDPQHAEALVKKGDALEQVRKPDEAIACYDRAIEADRRFTLAYLHKGGLYNRLERHEDALKCYEEALKTQTTASA